MHLILTPFHLNRRASGMHTRTEHYSEAMRSQTRQTTPLLSVCSRAASLRAEAPLLCSQFGFLSIFPGSWFLYPPSLHSQLAPTMLNHDNASKHKSSHLFNHSTASHSLLCPLYFPPLSLSPRLSYILSFLLSTQTQL